MKLSNIVCFKRYSLTVPREAEAVGNQISNEMYECVGVCLLLFGDQYCPNIYPMTKQCSVVFLSSQSCYGIFVGLWARPFNI